MNQYAVFGNPISHSKSPDIHMAFAQQTKKLLHYTKKLVKLDQFNLSASVFFQGNGQGLNITVPFKEEAYQWVDELDLLAQRAGAVNTISLKNGKTKGYNTDGLGLVHDLIINNQVTLEDKNILILGAGGAVRGILEPILHNNPASITITNRTIEKAETLVHLFNDLGHVQACSYKQLENSHFDLIINGTSSGLNGKLPPIPDNILRKGGSTYDMIYAQEPTAFVQWGLEHGANLALDGLGMLVEQAAEAFMIWHGLRPNTNLIMKQIRKSYKNTLSEK